MLHDVSGVILIGGKSRRMGVDKRFLSLGGQTFLEHVVAVTETVCREIILVSAQAEPGLAKGGHSFVVDEISGTGSFGGVYTGLLHSSSPYVFVVACDMPFLKSTLIEFMSSFRYEFDAVIARIDGQLHPLHGFYSKNCLPYMRKRLEQRQLSIQKICEEKELRVKILDRVDLSCSSEDLLSFFNANTPSDFEFARKILE